MAQDPESSLRSCSTFSSAVKTSTHCAAMAIPMKGMKGMKSMKSSKVARGRGAKARVFSGKKVKTSGGLTKDKLCKNKNGKVVSRASSAAAKKRFAQSPIKAWSLAVKQARKALDMTGFVPIGGKSARGRALYAKAKAILNA